MLVLSRKLGEKVWIGENICITVVDIDRGKIRLGIDAPRDLPIYRPEYKLPEPPAPPPQAHTIIQCPDCEGGGRRAVHMRDGGVSSSVCATCSGKGVIAVIPDAPPASGQRREGVRDA